MPHLAGKASTRQRPVNSALGSTWGQARVSLPLPARHEGTLAFRLALCRPTCSPLPRVSSTRPAFPHRRAAIRPLSPVARRAHSLPLPARLANAAGRCLTCRSTGASTAWRLDREALVVHVAPRGPGATPFRPGYLYVRPHVCACNGSGKAPRSVAAVPGVLRSGRAGPVTICRHARSFHLPAYSRSSPSGASRRHPSAAARAVSGSVVVGASRQRAAPHSQFTGAPPALPLARLVRTVQAAP
jgi:hypothetical protein